jgi:hypothetical protein
MTEKQKKQKAFGLVLDLGGASGYHTVQNVYGVFHPEIPTPVGGPGEPSYEQAKQWTADEGMPLRMVEIEAVEVPELREAAAEARKVEQRGATEGKE